MNRWAIGVVEIFPISLSGAQEQNAKYNYDTCAYYTQPTDLHIDSARPGFIQGES